MPKTTFDAKPFSLQALLSSEEPIYEVPRFQRRYSWTSEHWETLWDDLRIARGSNESEYFLGTIVVIGEGKPFKVIDGQQRLATITAMLGAIRDHLEVVGDKDTAKDIQRKFITRVDYRGNVFPILKLGVADQEEYRRYVQLSSEDPDRFPLGSKQPRVGPGRPPVNPIRGVFDYYHAKIGESVNYLPNDAAKQVSFTRIYEPLLTTVFEPPGAGLLEL